MQLQLRKELEEKHNIYKLVDLENRAWRGLRAYTPSFKDRKTGLETVLEISSGKGGIYLEREYTEQEYHENQFHNDGHWMPNTYGDRDYPTFNTFKECLHFIGERFGLICEYPNWSKELINEWTWEQNIAYAEGQDEKVCELMAKDVDIRIVELNVLDHIVKNPNCTTEFLQKEFEGGIKDIDHSVLSRLAHDYGQPQTPIIAKCDGKIMTEKGIKQVNPEGWVVTEQGTNLIERTQKELKEKGYILREQY